MGRSTTPDVWPSLIVALVRIKERLAEVDGGFWPFHLPELRASDSLLQSTESKLGFRFQDSYRDFLLHSNGWKGFFQTIDLLSCDELIGGEHQRYFWGAHAGLQPEEWQRVGLDQSKILPIGVTLEDRASFVLDFSNTGKQRFLWLGAEVVDEWGDFADFFRSMIEYNRLEIDSFVAANPPS